MQLRKMRRGGWTFYDGKNTPTTRDHQLLTRDVNKQQFYQTTRLNDVGL